MLAETIESNKTSKEEVDQSVYKDYAEENFSNIESPTLANGPGGDPPFPVKLHYTLTELKKDGLDHVVSWMPHGR